MFCLHDDRQKSHHRCAHKNIIHTVLGVELKTVALFVPYCLSSESYVQNWPNLVILRFSTLSLMIGTVVFE